MDAILTLQCRTVIDRPRSVVSTFTSDAIGVESIVKVSLLLSPDFVRAALPERIYSRFAQISLELFCEEESFPIEVPEGQDVDRTVQAFRDLDCDVELGPKHNWITVTCPRK